MSAYSRMSVLCLMPGVCLLLQTLRLLFMYLSVLMGTWRSLAKVIGARMRIAGLISARHSMCFDLSGTALLEQFEN